MPGDAYTLDGDSIGKLRADHERLASQFRNTQLVLSQVLNAAPGSPASKRVRFRNDSGQDAPAYACLQVIDTYLFQGIPGLIVTQPLVAGQMAARYVLNGPEPIVAGGTGWCQVCGDARALFSGSAPAAGDLCGPYPGTWSVRAGSYPPIFTADGGLSGGLATGNLAAVQNFVFAGVAQADIADSAWGAFIISDGTAPAVFNLSGATIHNGDIAIVVRDLVTLNYYAIKSGSGATLVRFELTDDLVYGTDPGSDNAVLLTYHGGAYHADGAAIRVFDWTNDSSLGTWSGKAPVVSPAKSGYQGYAILKPDRGVYEIVWMEQKAQLISFRLYQHLTTANASQANVPVLSFWNGRDPDPTGAKITVYNLLTDYTGVYKYSGDANAVGYAIWNEKLSQYQIIALEGDGQRWVLVKNSSGYTAPANSVVGVLGVTRDANGHTNKRNILTFERPSTTFRRNYLITGYADIANGAIGVAFSTEGPMEATYDSGTPANGESWGPKPGQFTLSKGFPGFIVEGLNSDDSLAVVRFEPILQLLAKTTAKIAIGTDNSHYEIYTGTQGSESDSGLSVPTAEIRNEPIPSGAWCWLRWINNGWELEPMIGQGFARYILGTFTAALSAGGSVSCTVSTVADGLTPGSPVTVHDYAGIFSSASGTKHYLAAYSPTADQYFFVWVTC